MHDHDIAGSSGGSLDASNDRKLDRQGSSPALDPQAIRGELEKGVALKDLPAFSILRNQIDRNYRDILTKAPNTTRQNVAFNLALRFGIGIKPSLYHRISEHAFELKPFERFDSDDEIAPMMPSIVDGINRAKEEIVALGRPSVRFTESQAWLYVDQGKRGATEYRIYLSPQSLAIGKVFAGLAKEVPEGVGYQMKTFDPPISPALVARQDKIVVYCSKDNFDSILLAVGRVHERYRSDFADRLGPGGGTIVPLEGVSVAKQSDQILEGHKITGTQEVANRIQSKMDERLPVITREALSKFKTFQEAYDSDAARFLWQSFLLRTEDVMSPLKSAPFDPDNSASREIMAKVAQTYLKSVFDALLGSYIGGTRNIDIVEIKRNFLQMVRGTAVGLTNDQFNYFQKSPPYLYDNYLVTEKITAAVKRAGLMIAIDAKLKDGKLPGDALGDILN